MSVDGRLWRDSAIGFHYRLLPHQKVQVVRYPREPFLGKRLIIASDIAGYLTVEDILVGESSQLSNDENFEKNGGMPGRSFQEDCLGARDIELAEAGPDKPITLVIWNSSRQHFEFAATLYGVAAIPP